MKKSGQVFFFTNNLDFFDYQVLPYINCIYLIYDITNLFYKDLNLVPTML